MAKTIYISGTIFLMLFVVATCGVNAELLPTLTPLENMSVNVSAHGHAKVFGDHNKVKTTHMGMITSGWRQSNCPSTRYYNRYGQWVSGGMYGCEYDNLPDGKYYACLPFTYTQLRSGTSGTTGHASGEQEHMQMFGRGCNLVEVSDEMKDWYLYNQVYIRYWNGTWGTYYNPYQFPDPLEIVGNMTK